MADLAEVFKNRLRAYREMRGFSQAVLAEKAGISPSFVAEMELGRRAPTFKTIEKLANALNIEPFQLLVTLSPSQQELLEAYTKTLMSTGGQLLLKGFGHQLSE